MKLLIFLLTTLSLQARPGQKLSDQFPDLSAQALVTSAVTTPDGSTFLMGYFAEADGITRPGLAKLTPTGHLDPTFAPLSFALFDYQVNPPIYFFSNSPHTREPLFPLQRGGLIITSPFQWELRNPDGTLNTSLLPQYPRDSDTPPIPQFEKDNSLFITAHIENRIPSQTLLSLDSETLLPNSDFIFSEDSPAPPFQASPAADGKIWVLGRNSSPVIQTGFNHTPPAHYLYRILPDGALDPSFTPEQLKASNTHALVPNPGPGLQLASTWPGRGLYWPAAQYENVTFETRDQNGVPLFQTGASFNFGSSSFSHLLPSGEILSQSLDFGDLIIKNPTTYEITFTLPFQTPDAPPSTKTVTQFPDGKFLIGGNRRFLPDGTPDPTWHTTRLSRPTTIKHLIPLQDETILAVGDFDLASGIPRSGAIKLNRDTSLNPSFTPEIDLRNARKILQKQNGNLIVFLAKGYRDDEQNNFFIIELSPHGDLIAPFRRLNISTFISANGPNPIDQSHVTNIHLQSDDSLIVSTYRRGSDVSSSSVIRFPSPPDSQPKEILQLFNFISQIFILPDDRILIGNQLYTPDGTPLTTTTPAFAADSRPNTLLPDGTLLLVNSSQHPKITFQKWHPDTGIDLTFGNQIGPPLFFTGFAPSYVVPISNNKLLVRTTINDNLYGSPSQLIRLHSNGHHDPSFQITQTPDSSYTNPAIIPLQNQNGPVLWIGGVGTDLNGQNQSSLAVIDNTSTNGFDEWITATSALKNHTPSDLLPDSDPDNDGATNLFEYAASTDPFQSSPQHAQARQISPLTFQIPCNPEAPEILRQLQTSPDLLNWSPASANQVRLETTANCLTWTLLPHSPRTFTRLRILK